MSWSRSTPNPAAKQGFLYAKLALTYDEPFKDMCLPDVCLTDRPRPVCSPRSLPDLASSSIRTGRRHYSPAGGEGVLGRLLGALEPTQRSDHVVMFVEDDGATVRHCTDPDARLKEKVYINGRVRVKTPSAMPMRIGCRWPVSAVMSRSLAGRGRSASRSGR